MKILGVDIGSYSIKIAELDANTKGYVVTNFLEYALSVDQTRDRQLQIIEILRDVAANYDSGSTMWIIGIPQNRLSVRFKRFPFRERAKIYKSLAFELEDDIPFDLDDTIFDFKVVEYIGTSANVLAVAAPSETVRETLATCKDGGFEPSIVSVESLALANIFEAWNVSPPEGRLELKDPDTPYSDSPQTLAQPPAPARGRAILHLGHTRSVILLYREGSLITVRSILWGGSEIAASLTRAMKIPLHEAMKVLAAKSFILVNSAGATKEQLLMSEAVASQVDNLIREVRLTFLDVKPAFNVEIDNIELVGGASQIQNLGAYITQGLEIPVNPYTGLMNGRSSRFDSSPHFEAVAAVSLGLALEGLKRQRNPAINLRRNEFARENRTLKLFWERWRLPMQIAASAFAIFFLYSVIRDQIASSLSAGADEKVAEAALKAANLKGSSAGEAGIAKYLKTQRDRINHQEAISQLDNYVTAVDVLARISDKFPAKVTGGQDVDITLIDISDGEVTIKGRAHSPAQVNQVQKGLNDIAVAKSLSTVPALDVTGGVAFGFKFKVTRKKM